MTTFQPGIFALGTRFHHHLEFDLRPGAGTDAIRAAVRRLSEPAGGIPSCNVVIGFGADLWGRLAGSHAPAGLAAFTPVVGTGGRRIPATQHDLWVWVHGAGPDVTLDCARVAAGALSPGATVAAEQPGFTYLDSRDMTGFIDGTENPSPAEAPGVALVADGERGAGGSHALVMRWVHDLAAFAALDAAEQEAVIGRTRVDSVELDDAVKPPTAHIARVVIEDEAGEELEILRRSTPFGTVAEQGLEFVAFSREPARMRRMLERMAGTPADGLHDRLMEFSRPVSAALYFAPSLDELARL